MSLPDVWLLVTIAIVALLAAGAIAPLEALGWWAGWFEGLDRHDGDPHLEPPDPEASGASRQYLVFLTGIHSVSGDTFAQREKFLLQRLRGELPDTRILEVFPYSVTNRPLTGQRFFGWYWRWAASMKVSRRTLAGMAGMVINLRNLWQMGVSADRRYGPIYNRGSALLIVDALRGAGCRQGDSVMLVGYSGGGQIALGAGPHVKDLTGSEIAVVSLGGIMSSDPDIGELAGVWDLHGDADRIRQIGNMFFPGRWPFVPYSSWNQAKRDGVVQDVPLGPPDHTGEGGYLDRNRTLPDGRSYLDQSVDVLAAIARREDPRKVSVGARAQRAR